ncbi:MAG: sulfite exporter TauE/SafE family protein [Leptolyngbyaceae cyanobacterium bins.59]|nr:sulfite exporter TauE/SafE family protein [Leptolyngbyaceae cyanobacterium bins.59]
MFFDLLLVLQLGFLGSFGHCIGMCGPLAVAFSLSGQQSQRSWQQRWLFHILLNLGRILSYALVGAAIGGLGSVLIAGGQLAGVESLLRRSLAIVTGLLLIWMGLSQIYPNFLPQMPLMHPLLQGNLHNQLSRGMVQLSMQPRWWTPALLGLTWGLIPCGFLYAAQIKAAETGNLWQGILTMLAFGLGTLPSLLGVGVSASSLSADRRSQLFRMGGWVTLTIGILTLLRSDDMTDYTGHTALACLMLALVARPISRVWPHPLRFRRALGVGAFVLSLAHVFHMLDHALSWDVEAIAFLLPEHQWGLWTGITALLLLTPLTLTSTDRVVKWLGDRWRILHLLAIPALILAAIHTVLIGSHYLGNLEWTGTEKLRTALLGGSILLVLLLRWRIFWSFLRLERFYATSRS